MNAGLQSVAQFSPAPLDIDVVLDARWLSWALSSRGQPVEVSQVRVVEKIGPSALSIRIDVTYGKPPPAGMPSQFCIKGIFDERFLSTYVAGGTQKRETTFYKEIAPHISVRVPICYFAGVDEETLAGVIVMEDMIASGAHFLSVHKPYSAEQAAKSLDQLARLHAGTRQFAESGQFPWVRATNLASGEGSSASGINGALLTRLMADPRGEPLPASLRDGDRIVAAMAALAERGKTIPACFIHGDAHAGNLFEEPNGVGFLDWQTISRGNWSIDVGYHIATVLEPQDRQQSEKDLLRHYLERRIQHGDANPPGFEEAWTLYRQSIAYGFFMWAVTQRVVPHTIYEYVRRLGAAVQEHDSFGLLRV
jgi:hypothetical protein